MNLISDYEAHGRDEEFDREDAKRHREPCSPAGDCYIPYVANVKGEPHYCDLHRPCPACEGTGLVSIEDGGDITEATCGECERTRAADRQDALDARAEWTADECAFRKAEDRLEAEHRFGKNYNE